MHKAFTLIQCVAFPFIGAYKKGQRFYKRNRKAMLMK